MRTQPVPMLKDEIVDKLLSREFPDVPLSELTKIVALYRSDDVKSLGTRVKVACIKNAAGNLEELRKQIQNSTLDYRDTLLQAEYPLCGSRMFENLTKRQKQEVYESDWKQYVSWIDQPLEFT